MTVWESEHRHSDSTIRRVHQALAQVYGQRTRRDPEDPLDELILTLLSQHTNDANRDRAFLTLKKRFSTWEKARQASPAAIADAIWVGGLAEVKSHRIKQILNEIKKEFGKLSLDVLQEVGTEEGTELLRRFPGVGPKTAACVLLFSCGRPVFPVDTHVHRVTRRLGWIDAKTDANRAHEILDPLIPDALKYPLHLNLIAHGRAICKPQRPRCDACTLARLCPKIGVGTCHRGTDGPAVTTHLPRLP